MSCVLFPGSWTHYLDRAFAAEAAQIPSSLLLLELGGYYVNTVQLHVNATDALVRRGVDGEGLQITALTCIRRSPQAFDSGLARS